MKTIQVEIPDGKKAMWVNDVLTLVDDKPTEYKFKVGDKVRNTTVPEFRYTVKECHSSDGQVVYILEHELGGETALNEKYLELIPQDITERIKTIDDALRWCMNNGRKDLIPGHHELNEYLKDMQDVIAYLKLRVITCALNEGWEPKLGNLDERYDVYYNEIEDRYETRFNNGEICDKPSELCFRRSYLARYAAKQFRDIYADFCGVKKGGEK